MQHKSKLFCTWKIPVIFEDSACAGFSAAQHFSQYEATVGPLFELEPADGCCRSLYCGHPLCCPPKSGSCHISAALRGREKEDVLFHKMLYKETNIYLKVNFFFL